MADAVPPAPILWVASKFVKSISSIGAAKNIDAKGFEREVDRTYYFVFM